jgi:hypothetical protein
LPIGPKIINLEEFFSLGFKLLLLLLPLLPLGVVDVLAGEGAVAYSLMCINNVEWFKMNGRRLRKKQGNQIFF